MSEGVPQPVVIFINDKAQNLGELVLNNNWNLKEIDEDINNIYRILISGQFTGWIVKTYKNTKRAEYETKCLYTLDSIEGVPKILASGIGEFNYAIMSEIPGIDLFTYVKKFGFFTEAEFKLVIKKVLKILKQVHSKGIIHRDIKPENIIYDGDTGNVGLVDFEDTMTEMYYSPEQLESKKITNKTDIWSIGITIHEMIFMEIPFKNETSILQCCPQISAKCSHELKTLLKGIFRPEKDRLSIDDILQDIWFVSDI